MRIPTRRLVTPILAGALALTGAVALAPAANAAPSQAAQVAPARAALGVSVVKDYGSDRYYSAKVTVTNRGTSTADRWNVRLTLPSEGSSVQIYSLDGTPLTKVYTGRSTYSISTDADLPAGSSASFLYVVVNARYAQPSVRVS